MKRKILDYIASALFSIGIGTVITTIFIVLFDEMNDTIITYIVWSVASVLYGLSARIILCNEKLTPIVATLIHCVFCMLVTIITVTICGWPAEILLVYVLPSFFICYVIIYSVVYMITKSEVDYINSMLKKRRSDAK